ncbi:lipid biosynthesis B12-binding/radical SAM protein [Geobacter sp. DSM 9736]|uniref:lipid biosynthesis B12-binding/radical SAM protein n=1 Tax=Geobacter sp. DSM 9736 TaxID=1277350 RepID=UPI000B50FC4D|nr:lipid biosynthesis B12-binding/radical SAM protein [Geobacter sp. DSM 9736]SNB47645.1 Radical SAM superfamily enzyme YgiQ, UPF0313 family [Geobacter sp. DSM 9736]
MKLLLVSANREQSPYPVFPLGLSYLAAPLVAAGHTLRVADVCFAQRPEEDVASALDEFQPDAILISIRNIDNVTWPGTRFYLGGVRDIVAQCKGRGTVILGGSGFSLMPREVLEYAGGDYGVVGEGEEALVELLHRLERGGPVTGLPGVVIPGEDDFIPPRHLEHFTTPDRRLFELGRYRDLGGMANVQTKRGCPFACVYCTYPKLEGSSLRLRPISDIIGELRDLTGVGGIDYIYFVDDIFNYPIEFALELCRAIRKEGLSFGWSAFINPGFVTLELLQAMADAGCDAVELGTDSGSPTMLRNLRKSFGVDEIRNASLLCRNLDLAFAHYLLFGGPGETEATMAESFSLMDEVDPTAVIAMTGIRLFPGTPLHDLAVAEGLSPSAQRLLEPFFYISPEVAPHLASLVTEHALARRNWVVPGLEINMSDSMLQMLRHFPVRGPLWKLMKRLGRTRVKPLSS